MKKFFHIIFLAGLLLAGCGTSRARSIPALPFTLVTAAPNASPTPTPFQPIPWTPTGTLQSQPMLDPATPTADSPRRRRETPVPTIDPNLLINTVVPFSTIDASGSQVLNNGQETVNFLLIGSDRRPGGSFRTDTMVIAILRPNEGQVSLISIPRDLWVSIPGWENQRINTAYQHGISVGYPGGGPGLLKDTILYNLGIRIDHTAMVEFDGFRQIVDTLGGVDVPVSCPYTDWRLIDPSFDPENENNWQLYTTGPGVIHMDGDLALWYARSRQKSSDFDRGRRQQEVLRSLFTQALQAGRITRIPELYNNLQKHRGNRPGPCRSFATLALRTQDDECRYPQLLHPPAARQSWITEGGAYVLLPNEEALQQMLTEALSPSTQTVERQTIVIDVMNGTSITGYETLAATRLNYAGYETHIIPSDRQDYAYSVLIDKTAAQDRAQSDPILNVMGMQPGSLIPGRPTRTAPRIIF